MIYELGLCEERNTFFCCWDMLLGYSSKNLNRGGGGLIELNPGISHQKRSGISRGDQEKIMCNFQGYLFFIDS